jgi:RNA polymerase sigma-70 factor (ECF subfamily)
MPSIRRVPFREDAEPDFQRAFAGLFHEHFPRLFRYVDRRSGDPDLAADLAQEAFVRLYRRGSLPDAPEAWLISVAMNLFRNAMSGGRRRREILALVPADQTRGDPAISPERHVQANETRRLVRAALDSLPERERDLLLLRSEGYAYGDLAAALGLNEASVGTLLARAREAFKRAYGDPSHAS